MKTNRVEFKVQFTNDLYKEVIAFANSDGGEIYVGIDDDGRVVGLPDVNSEHMKITNGLRDAIAPDVTMFIKTTVREDKVVHISIGEGTNKPYYLKSKGLKPSGVFVRQGTSCAPASVEQIRRMIKDSDGDVYEENRSMNQALNFEDASAFFKRYNVEFSEEKYAALGICRPSDRLYTNLAAILSDECPYTVKVAVFADDNNTAIKDLKEFSGSVFRQLGDSFSYLMLCNKVAATFRGLERIERADYPEEAIREALLNAIVHRDYSFSGSIIINVNESQMEFVSIGGLLQGLTPEDIRSGISQPRNKKLAAVFHRLRLIESYGTGIRKIFNLYSDCAAQPRIEVTPNTFKIVLPNMNATKLSIKESEPVEQLSPQKKAILRFIEENGKITEQQVQSLLKIKQTRAYTLMNELKKSGLISDVGRGADKFFIKKK
ncbi:MAG: putative DNA binding domain-containing protein [Clostridia bacterium]|nr:putative DNA binding domain-containing protein [Clostridia bacterium]